MENVIQFAAKKVELEASWQQAAGAEFEYIQPDSIPAINSNVISVAELPGDAELVRNTRKDLFAAKAGELVLSEAVEVETRPIKNLYEAIICARDGDSRAREMVRANVSTHTSETIFKTGNYKKVSLSADEGGISQNGQYMDDVHANAYRYASGHPVLVERTLAEAGNGARIERAYRAGLLEENYFVVFSLCEEELSDEELDELLFFSNTKSLSIQVTSLDGKELYTETAFVAGVAEEGAERHDRRAIESIAESFGIDYSQDSTAQIINKPMLVPKTLMPDGVIDLVTMFDQDNGTFFGQNKPVQDYEEFKEFCLKREASFSDDVEQVVDRLILEADILSGPAQASKRLSKLVEERLVKKAVEDKTIEEWVFGPESAENILLARTALAEGNKLKASSYEQTAIETARSGACTAGSCGLEGVSSGSHESKIAQEFGATSKDDVIKDTERSCVKCNSQSVIYILSKKLKVCTNCRANKTY